MKTSFLSTLLIVSSFFANSQRIDDNFAFDTNPNKKYSLYIPASYDGGTPNKLMVAFHPFNTARWDAIAWRDTLINFAESTGLILACPDGGTNGRVDDAIDYGFTTALIDSVKTWYNIDNDNIFAMGFSVGGKATYEYGLTNSSMFQGFIPIGAAINGTNEVNGIISKAKCKAFYLIHGEQDAPNIRFTPIKGALEQNKAEVENILMAGVGHTIDFPNRNKILRDAFNYIDTVNCTTPTGIETKKNETLFVLSPNPVSASKNNSVILQINLKSPEVLTIEVWSLEGKLVYSKIDSFQRQRHPISIGSFSAGTYLMKVHSNTSSFSQKFVVE